MHAVGDTGATPVPAFLTKLWTLVEDPSTNEFIFWDATGNSFHVYDHGRFSKEILPMYFKHSNIASFIRQLNMYGFRKVVGVESGGLKVERDDMEFAHQFFLRENENLLEHIKRKRGMSSQVPNVKADEMKVRSDDVQRVLNDVRTMKGKQDSVNSKLEAVKRENELLWLEIANLRQKHMKQQQIVNKLIQFLMSLVGNRGVDRKRKMPLMLNDASQIEVSKMPKFSHSRSIELSGKGYQVSSPEVPTSTMGDQLSTSTLSIHEVTEPIYNQANVTAASTPPTAATTTAATIIPPQTARKTMPQSNIVQPQLVAEDEEDVQPPGMDEDEEDVHSRDILRELVEQNVPPIDGLNTGMISEEPLLTLATDVFPLVEGTFGQPQTLPTPNVCETVCEADDNRSTSTGAARVTDAVLGAGAMVPANTNHQPNNPKVLNREMSEHLDTMQGDLDSLKDLLSGGQYTFEPSTIMGMFELGGGVPTDQQPSTSSADFISGNEVVQYNPPDDIMSLFDFGDLSSSTPLEEDDDNMQSSLNTPYISTDMLDGPRLLNPKASTTTSTEEVD